jgi:hypothetical protein
MLCSFPLATNGSGSKRERHPEVPWWKVKLKLTRYRAVEKGVDWHRKGLLAYSAGGEANMGAHERRDSAGLELGGKGGGVREPQSSAPAGETLSGQEPGNALGAGFASSLLDNAGLGAAGLGAGLAQAAHCKDHEYYHSYCPRCVMANTAEQYARTEAVMQDRLEGKRIPETRVAVEPAVEPAAEATDPVLVGLKLSDIFSGLDNLTKEDTLTKRVPESDTPEDDDDAPRGDD